MCGRFLLRCAPESWPVSLLGDADQPLLPAMESLSEVDPILLQPRTNVSPTQMVFAVVAADQHDRRLLKPLRWGLVPSWSDDKKIGASMINARSETVDEKRSFKKLFAEHRCLIPADGYYEWLTEGKKKQPYRIERPDRSLFCFAGCGSEMHDWVLRLHNHYYGGPRACHGCMTECGGNQSNSLRRLAEP